MLRRPQPQTFVPADGASSGPAAAAPLFHPTISPHDSRIALVACDMTGAYLTRDGGATWRMFNLGEPVRSFVFDPLDVNVIYALTQGAFRSDDGGATWKRFFPRAAQVGLGDDHASGDLIAAGHPIAPVTALAIDPADSRSLYLAQGAALSYTADGGVTWRKSARPARPRAPDLDRPAFAEGDRTLYAAGPDALYIRRRGKVAHHTTFRSHHGDRRHARRSSMPPSPAKSMSLPTAAPPGAIPPSRDFKAKPPPSPPTTDHPEIAYVSYSGLRAPVRPTWGVAKTIDAGRHWEPVYDTVRDAWLTDRFGAGWAGNPIRPRCGAA